MIDKENPLIFRQGVLVETDDSSQRHQFLSLDDIVELEKGLGGENYHRLFFGYILSEALQKGFLISKKAFFEATENPVAENTAKTISKLLNELGYGDSLSILELFSGTGQVTHSFAKSGFTITTVEQDPITFQYAQHNLLLSGVSGLITAMNMDANIFLERAISNGSHFGAVYLDPPWNEKFTYNDPSKPFLLEYTVPPSDALVSRSLQLAPIISLKLPLNVNQNQVISLGSSTQCKVLFQKQLINGFPNQLNVATAYFIKGQTGYVTETTRLPRR